MNFFAAEDFNDFLAELTQPDAGAGEAGIGSDQSEDISLRRRRVPAEQKIRCAKMKETECVTLNHLAEVHQAAQFVGGGWDVDGHERVAGLGRSERVADGTNSADALGDAGHFAVGPALAEFLEAAKLDDVKLGVGHVALVVHENADLGVALDAGHGINDNAF